MQRTRRAPDLEPVLDDRQPPRRARIAGLLVERKHAARRPALPARPAARGVLCRDALPARIIAHAARSSSCCTASAVFEVKPAGVNGIIGNCAYSALVDERGSIVWCCLPRFDSDPVFNGCSTQRERQPVGLRAGGLRAQRTPVRTQHRDPEDPAVRPPGPGHRDHRFRAALLEPRPHLPPADMVRRVRVLGGTPRIRVVLRPRFDWGREPPRITRGSTHIRYVGPEQTLRVNTDAPIDYILSETFFVVDRPLNFILGPDETLTSGIEDTARAFEQDTGRLLAQLVARAVAAAGMAGRGDPRRHHAQAVAVRGHRRHRRRHDHQHPGSANSGRNWDYRYCWLRDAFFVVRALNSISEVATMEEYLRWLNNVVVRSRGGHIQPLYGVGQEENLQEAILDTCPATAAWARCAWATRPPSTSSTTCTATSCWAPRRRSTTTAC
jgi:hypothetical protein